MSQDDAKTLSWRIDQISDHINKSKEYSAILYSLNAKPDVTIKFVFGDNPVLVDIFNEDPEEFPALVKASFIFLANANEKTKERIRLHTKIEITESMHIKLNEWGAKYEGVPVAVDCQVIGTNKQETYTKFAQAYCTECGNTEQLLALGRLPRCPDKDCDGHKKPMTFDKSTLKTGDIKTVIIQEPIEESKNGTPVSFDCLLKDDYALMTHIGQRIRLIGTFRSYPQKDKITNQILINAISLFPLDEVKELQPSNEQIQHFWKLKDNPKYFEILAESIAPEIKHEYLAKFCVLISLIGSPEVDRMIGMIHTLLIGNPGTGKSKILEYILLLMKKSALAVGGTMSGSGITVTMDTLPNRQKMPRAGIIPLCSGGVAAIDEANQIEDEDYGKMYQCMGSGWINYNKGGFDLTLKAMTTIVAGANPKYYTYNTQHSIVDNINMPAPLISRFSLIVNMHRKKSDIERQQVLHHINLVDRIGVTEYIKQAGLLLPEDLAALITYCKTFNPVSTEEADALAMDFQLKMESIEQADGSLPIDNRFYYSVKKIAKAIARLYFSNKVLPEHVQVAINTIKTCLATFDMNVEAGQLQMKMVSDAKGWKDSFYAVCAYLQNQNPDGRFSEDECINTMLVQYPEFFKNVQMAEKRFIEMASSLDKVGGRLKLV